LGRIILVIGGNAAGPAAAAKAKRSSPEAEVILFEKSDYISTGSCELPYLFSGEIKDYNKLLFYTPDNFRAEKGVLVKTRHEVLEIIPKEKRIIVFDKNKNYEYSQQYDSLILTTGSVANKIEGLDYSLGNVFTFKTISDFLRIDEYIKQNNTKKISIIGAGYIGIELAETLTNAGYEITLIEKESLPLPAYCCEIRKIVNEILSAKKIRFISGITDFRFIQSDGGINGINCDGRIIETDLLITCVGFTPNNKLALNAKLKTGNSGGLITDSRLRTSDFSIFAAGDNVEVSNFITNKYDYIPSAVLAHNYGHIAGENATGGANSVNKVVKNTSLKFFDSYICKVGITEKEALNNNFIFSKETEILPNLVKVMPESRPVFGKIIFEKRNKFILGAQFIGGKEVSGYADIITAFITNKISAEKLADINFNYTPALSPFVNILSSLGRKIKHSK